MVSTPSKTTTVSKTELPEWVDQAAQKNLAIADDLAKRPYQAYGGSLTADPSQLQVAANQNALKSTGAWKSGLDASTAMAGAAGSYQPSMVSGGSFLSGDINKYMNPYIDNVESRAVDSIGRTLTQNLNGLSSQAVSAGAFGGSRQGIMEGVAQGEAARAAGDLSAKLRSDAYGQAAQMMDSDMGRALAAQQSNQQAGLNAAGLKLNAAQQTAANAGMASELAGKDTALLATLGESQRAIEQQKLQENYAKWKEQQDFPLQQLNLRLAAVGATPYGASQTQTSTGGSSSSSGMQLFGGILGLLPMLAGLSDRNEKTDIKKLGKDPATGLDMYAFRYKGDPKSYPKIVGPMAQDVEKKYPHAVREINGKKVVNFGALGFGAGPSVRG